MASTSSFSSMPAEAPSNGDTHRADAIRDLKARDNITNFYYLTVNYLILIATLVATIWSYSAVAQAGLGWWWNIPATMVAIAIMGATQHQFGGVVHEGTHHILFANRKQSELVSDWFAAFPIFTSTYNFRLHHLAHHQFVNDPVRDPNFDQAREGGIMLDFPVEHIELMRAMLRWLWLPNLSRYIMARLRYSALGGTENSPYANRERRGSNGPTVVGALFVVGTPLVVLPFALAKMFLVAGLVIAALLAAAITYLLVIPDRHFMQSRLNPIISHRTTQVSRVFYIGMIYSLINVAEYFSGHGVWLYFLLLWVVPLFTTFPMFMIMREWLQHGNADRGRYTNSRVLLANPFFRYAVLPWGMDYHLPHHIVANVPHYNLKKLHDYLQQNDPQYAAQGSVVENWTLPGVAGYPTMVEALGPKYSISSEGEVYIAPDVLEYADVNDAEGLAEQERLSREAGP